MKKPIITGNTIKIPSDLNYLAVVDEFVEGILRGYGADESIIADIAISVSELINNSVNHGNKAETEQPVEVSVNKNGDNVSISITDQGSGFDPEEIADPLAEENLLKNAGRGIFIVKSLMDSIEVETTDRGTKITITKAI